MAVTPSDDRRFHPLTVLFALGGELRTFLVPIIFATFTARSRGGDVENWFLIFLIPSLFMATARYWFSTYRYAETELVVRTGVFFKNERHIPYARIQSVDAKQNVLHRLFRVVDVQVQTGTGGEAEATLSVLPLEALEEMRQRVFEGRAAGAVVSGVGDEAGGPAAMPAPAETVLSLTVRDTALSGLLDNRGWVVIGAAVGLLYEMGLFERFESLPQASWMTFAAIGAGLFVISPVLSVVWAIVRLHGFTLTRRGEELFTEYGALTRVTATIPLRRVQAVKILRSPGHLLTGRAAVRVETAGGHGAQGQSGASDREWVAPIIRMEGVDDLVRLLVPGGSLTDVTWRPADPRAVTRRVRLTMYVTLAAAAVAAVWFDWRWVAPAAVVLAAIGAFGARQYVRSLGWFEGEAFVAFRSGWLSQAITLVPTPKIQAVELQESPFDRRWAMASVTVDTAGAGAHPIDVPYLPRAVADDIHATLSARAAATEYRW